MAAGMERFVATMVYCEAPFDGTIAPAVPASDDKRNGSTAAEVASALLEAAKGYFSGAVPTPPPAPAQQHARDRDSVAVFFEAVALE